MTQLAQLEYFFICPYCGENISMLLDLSEEQQQYIEDCEVCCQPIDISFRVEEQQISDFSAQQS